MDKFIQLSYAASVALSQALMTFAQVRADQAALSNMTDKQIKALMSGPQKAAIGFNKNTSESWILDPEDLITIYYVTILTSEGEKIVSRDIEIGPRLCDASKVMQCYLGEGKIAKIKKEKVPFDDYIPF